MTSAPTPPNPWHGFVDDRGLVHDRATTCPHPSPYVGARVVDERSLMELPSYRAPLRIAPSGGAGMIAPVMRGVEKFGNHVVALDLEVRDLDDPVGNVRRFIAAATAADLPEETVLHVAMAGPASSPSWLAAADEVAADEHALIIDLDGPDPEAWVDVALDRELRFSLRGGSIERAVELAHTTARLWDAAGDGAGAADVATGRRWCRSWIGGHGETDRAVAYLESLE